jgi:hypothetical protein
MYITNPEKITNKVKCNGLVSKYFLERNIPILSREGNNYYFSDSELFREVLSFAPFWVKMFFVK